MESKIILGDCIESMKKLEDNSVDAIITDPPYGLEFMGKDWDKFKEGKNIAGGTTGIDTPFGRSKPLNSVYQYTLEEKNQFQIFTYNWAKEALRVLKPGGYLLSFGGTRTYHRMTCGIEDAGFEIRDCIMWLYGSGFPKSLNIGKQIDKMQGNEREVIGQSLSDTGKAFGDGQWESGTDIVEVTKGTSEWEGWGTALKPAVEPIVVARKPLSEKNVALNVLKWGTGGINIDECRIGFDKDDSIIAKNPHTLSKGTDAYDVNCYGKYNATETPIDYTNSRGRFPANIILECICDDETGKHTNPNCPCYILDEQSGIKKGNGHWSKTKTTGFGEFGNGKSEYFGVGEKDNLSGGASRFFMNIPKENIYKYCPLCYITLDKDSKEVCKKCRDNFIENIKDYFKLKQKVKQK